MGSTTQFDSYKTLILAVGYDETKHGYINPCQDVLDDKFITKDSDDEDDLELAQSPEPVKEPEPTPAKKPATKTTAKPSKRLPLK
jgi:hypothetical protein